MTGSRQFILPQANVWYNLWDLIAAAISDPTFTTQAYIPSVVNILVYQNASAVTNPNNAGAILNVSFDGASPSGEELLSSSVDRITGIISIKQVWFKFNVDAATLNISFASR